MSTKLRRYKEMFFPPQSTYHDSYHSQPLAIRKYETEPPLPPIKKRDVKYSHINGETYMPYNKHVPFDLMWRAKPKEIIRTNPHDIQKRYEKPSDAGLDNAQLTRPRPVMPPQVKVDDISDADVRKIIINDIYTTTRASADKEIAFPPEGVKAPRPDQPAPANPVFLPLWQPEYVSPEWRRETVSWEKRQLRSHIDVHKEFWTKFDNYNCPSCEQSDQVTKLRKMKLLP